MSAVAIELHEVLEQESVSMQGRVGSPPEAPITADDLRDPAKAAAALGVDASAVVARLNALRTNVTLNDAGNPAALYGQHANVSAATRRLLASYGTASADARLRINRRILDDLLGDAIRAARPQPDIGADQIVNLAGARATLQSYLRGDYRDEQDVAQKLEWLRGITDLDDPCCPARLFETSPRLTNDTAVLLRKYEEVDAAMRATMRATINRRILDDVFADSVTRFRDLRLSHLYGELHKEPDAEARSALCISGGGIRSATFALGVMQGLASRKLLHRFDYLSTVSGGGYIGSWLSSWARRHPEGICGVESDLAAIDSGAAANAPKLEPEAKPIRHLRQFSNYLTPRIGILSGDTWAFVALYLRNLTINLLVLVPLLATLLAVPRFSAFLLSHLDRMRFGALVAFADISMFAMYWYIGAARPVRHGSESADGPRWLQRIPPGWRFFDFCILPATGSATGVTLVWAKYAQLRAAGLWTSAHVTTFLAGAIVAFLAMTLAPCYAYFTRYFAVSYAARRESIASAQDDDLIRWRRFRGETLSALVAAAGAFALFWFFAIKVFDDPLGVHPEIDGVAPYQLAGLTLSSHRLHYVCFGSPVALLIFFLQATVFVAGSGKRNEDYDREWWGRAGGWLLAGGIGWMLLAGVSIYGPLAIYHAPTIVAALGGISGVVAIVLGRSSKSAANQKDGAGAGAADKSLNLAVPLFCLFLLASISWLTTLIVQKVKDTEAPDRAVMAQFQSVASREIPAAGVVGFKETIKSKSLPAASPEALASLAHLRTIERTTVAELAWFLVIAVAAFLASLAVGANRFSMHALYRNRLIRGYLGASRYDRDPDAVTGFDPYDNLQMYKLRPELLWASSFRKLDAFIAELREPKYELSKTIQELLQETTKKLLANTAIAERIDAFLLALDKQHDAAVRTELQGLTVHLPGVAKRLAAAGASAAIGEDDRKRDRAEAEKARRKVLREGTRNDLIDALFQDLNRIIIEEDLRKEKSPVLTAELRARNNRKLLDEQYRDWIVARPHRPPMHIVNMALNVTSGSHLAWQQRQATPFTASPLHCGSAFLGYRDSRKYGDGRRGISLGTAVTISGAAASPNQGYHSSPALAFLLTMFNVRLGWWLGNPGAAGQETFDAENPFSPVTLISRELVGHTDDRYPWVYLSDGGHFENLGLYEMILRRCRYIVVSDGGCDPKFTFEDLGNAIRKIRIDLGVPITLKKMPMFPRGDDEGWNYCVVGTIDYDAVDGKGAKPGTLVYFKPGFYRDDRLPKDVVNYGKESLDFPHETTADQWFSESQFESYRMLGRHAVEHALQHKADAIDGVKAFTERVAGPAEEAGTDRVWVPVVAEQIVPGGAGHVDLTGVMLPKLRRSPKTP